MLAFLVLKKLLLRSAINKLEETNNADNIRKLVDVLKKKGFKGEEVEIEKIAQNLYELGLFLVHLKVKEHSTKPKPQDSEGFEQIVREPP